MEEGGEEERREQEKRRRRKEGRKDKQNRQRAGVTKQETEEGHTEDHILAVCCMLRVNWP